MRVEVNGSVYGMNSKEFREVLKIASDAVPFGIYAICKSQLAILLNEKYSDKEELKKAVAEYSSKGFKVYYNNGKWQKKVYYIEFCAGHVPDGISVVCVYDKCKTDKNGSVIYNKEKSDFLREHYSVVI